MKKTHIIVSALALAVVLWGAVSADFDGEGKKGMRGEHREAIHAAVEANDYSQLSAEYQEKISQDKFAEMVKKHSQRDAHRAELEQIVAANDFDGFVAMRAEHKAEMEAKRAERQAQAEAEGKEIKDAPEREEPTTDELRTKFQELVDYYNENGELPNMEKAQKKWAKKLVKKARRWGLTDAQQGRVSGILDRLSDERLESILERVVNKIDTVEAKDFDEERKEKLLGILEMIHDMIEEKLG